MIGGLRARHPEVRFACSVSDCDAYAVAAAQAGADATIAAHRFSEDFESALRKFFPERFREIGGNSDV